MIQLPKKKRPAYVVERGVIPMTTRRRLLADHARFFKPVPGSVYPRHRLVGTHFSLVGGLDLVTVNAISGAVVRAARRLLDHDLRFLQEIRVIRYDVGGESTWHSDVNAVDQPSLTFVALLAGGDPDQLELLNYAPIRLHPGDAIMFRSSVAHRVKPVTRERFVLASWAE